MTSDLPIEIWDEILSYLPKGYAVKLFGVNRIFFEIGLDMLYKQARLTDFIQESRKNIEQLQYPNIRSRVRCISITSSCPAFKCSKQSILSSFGNFVKSNLQGRCRGITEGDVEFLTLALERFTQCESIDTIEIHVPQTTLSFSQCLSCLIRVLGNRVKFMTLKILVGELILFKSLPNDSLPNVERLTIKLYRHHSADRKYPTKEEEASSLKKIREISNLTRNTLTQFIISPDTNRSGDIINVTKLFGTGTGINIGTSGCSLGQFQKLESLELKTEPRHMTNSFVNFRRGSQSHCFSDFLLRNGMNLRRLSLGALIADSRWKQFVTPYETIINNFFKITLPNLEELEIPITHVQMEDFSNCLGSGISTSTGVPTGKRQFPELKKLMVLQTTYRIQGYSYNQFCSLIHGLVQGGYDEKLEVLHVKDNYCFLPHHLEVVYKKLSNLRELKISYQHLFKDPRNEDENDCYAPFRPRVYPGWKLEKLELGRQMPRDYTIDHTLIDIVMRNIGVQKDHIS